MSRVGSTSPLIFVVAYNSDDDLVECLRFADSGGDVCVIDNSALETTRAIAQDAGAIYIPSGRNIGFAAAINVGLSQVWDGKRDILLLNPDARVRRDDIGRLQDALHANPRHGVVAPRLLGVTGMPQRAWWPMPSPLQVWLDAIGLGRFWRGRRFLTGAVLMIRAAAVTDVGTFDERYFLYAEEADWQMRAQRSGWTLAVVTDVTATHVGGASSSDAALQNTLFHASAEAFARHWYGTAGWTVIRVGAMVAATRRALHGSHSSRRAARHVLRLYLRGPMRSAPSRPGSGL